MSNPYCSACHRNRPTADFHDGDMICYRHYIEEDPKHIPDPQGRRARAIYNIGVKWSKAQERAYNKAGKGQGRRPASIKAEGAHRSKSRGQKLCLKCRQYLPLSNFPADSEICYRHIPHFVRMGKLRALAEIRGEPISRVQKTREELDVALWRRRREKQKELDAMGPKRDMRLVKGGAYQL